MIPERLTHITLLASLAVASGFVDYRARIFPEYVFQTYIPGVLDGTYGAPAIYRVLAPYSIHALGQVTGLGPAGAWHLNRLCWFFAAYLILDAYLHTWFDDRTALTGTVLVAATLPLTFTNSWASADHIPELALFSLGCLAVARQRDLLFGMTLAAASLNRETAGFLVLLYAVGGPWSRRRAGRTMLFAAVWASIFVGLRLWRGLEHYEYFQLTKNLGFLKLLPAAYDPYKRAYAYFGLILFVPLAFLAFRHVRERPLFVRRALWVVPPFVLTALFLSSIIESRIFTPLYPLMLPAVMFGLQGSIRVPEEST